jgi:uncharacterized BrkB/YihY/UPF0761 family membrane protein
MAEPRSPRGRLEEIKARAEVIEQRAQERLTAERARRNWVQKAYDAFMRDRDQGGPLLAGGLAYRIFLWQLPAALFMISLLGVVATLAERDPDELARSTGIFAALAATIADAVAQAGTSRWWLLAVSLGLMLWAARGAARAVVLIASIAWQLPHSRRVWSNVRAPVAFTVFMLVAVFLQAVIAEWLDGPFVVDVALWVVTTAVQAAVVTTALALLPHRGHWTDVVPGALAFALVTRAGSAIGSFYLAGRLGRVDQLYGSLGVAILLQLWFYLLARLFLWAQFWNASLAGVGLDEPPIDSAP